MTKPAVPPLAREHVVEIDAMDVTEWESGQRTPQASDANLAELVRKTAAPPRPATRAQTVARERGGTQIGAPVIPRPPSRARTAPPGPAPEPARSRTSGGGPPAPLARATRVPDIPAGPAVEPPRSPAPPMSSGIDFSLPVTATGESGTRPSEPAPRGSPAPASGGIDFSLPVTATGESGTRPSEPAPRGSPAPASGGIDFSLPVTATGESSARPSEPAPPRSPAPESRPIDSSMPVLETSPSASSEPPRPRTAASSGTDFSQMVTAASESAARLPKLEPRPPGPARSLFAEASRVGPGHNASPAGSADPNTAWPPRPIPVDARLRPARRVAPDAASLPPRRKDAGGADRRKAAPTRHWRWWIGGVAAGSLAVVVAVALLPNLLGAPPEASVDSRRPLAAQLPAPRLDREPAAPRDPARWADAPMAPATGAAPAPAVVGLVDRRPTQPTAAGSETSMRIPSAEPAAAPRPHHTGKKPAARKVIVDYTTRPDETPPPSLIAQSAEDPAIGKARSAYTTGNQRLFVGDLDGAIRAYRQALLLYPGYVGGYRGLGLAYEELGDTANALAALRAYVATVPGARDVALIKKRIAHLQRR